MKIPLATDYKTRTGAPDKDARQKNSYIEVKNEQAIVRKRPSAQGGVSVGTGTAQGGYGTVLFWGDTAYPITEGTLTTCNNATNYVQGDHVTVDMVDYWANTSTVNTCPVGGVAGSDWSTSYVPAIGTLNTYATWNPTTKGSNVSLSNGNLTASIYSTTVEQIAQSTIYKTEGKWYWEITANGVGDINAQLKIGIGETEYAYIVYSPPAFPCGSASQSFKSKSGSGSACFGSSFSNGSVIGISLDMDNKTITISIDGISQGVMFSGLASSYTASCGVYMSEINIVAPIICTANFGATAFAYSVPSGYNSGLYE